MLTKQAFERIVTCDGKGHVLECGAVIVTDLYKNHSWDQTEKRLEAINSVS